MANRINRSLSVAYKILKDAKKDLEFAKLWKSVVGELKLNEKDCDIMAEFYTSLLLDRRFVMIGNNVWSLRRNFKFADIVVEIESVYDMEEPEEEIIEDTTIPELAEANVDAIIQDIKEDVEEVIVENIDDDPSDDFVADESTGFEEIVIPKK